MTEIFLNPLKLDQANSSSSCTPDPSLFEEVVDHASRISRFDLEIQQKPDQPANQMLLQALTLTPYFSCPKCGQVIFLGPEKSGCCSCCKTDA